MTNHTKRATTLIAGLSLLAATACTDINGHPVTFKRQAEIGTSLVIERITPDQIDSCQATGGEAIYTPWTAVYTCERQQCVEQPTERSEASCGYRTVP